MGHDHSKDPYTILQLQLSMQNGSTGFVIRGYIQTLSINSVQNLAGVWLTLVCHIGPIFTPCKANYPITSWLRMNWYCWDWSLTHGRILLQYKANNHGKSYRRILRTWNLCSDACVYGINWTELIKGINFGKRKCNISEQLWLAFTGSRETKMHSH